MTGAQIGQILALLGLALLIVGTMGRRRTRGYGPGRRGRAAGSWRWADYAAYVLIVAGLIIMWTKK